jgi:predicted DsbA family dithiol-disulfide isomerase
MAELHITHYTDPGCPWAFSAEPFRRKLSWTYGEQLDWVDRMVVLAEGPESYEKNGFDVEKQSAAFAMIGATHGMPIDDRRRPRMAGTAMACRAVVAARLHAPDQAPGLLRALRVRHFSGELLDDGETIAAAAADAGLEPGQLHAWMNESAVAAELDRDARAARQPTAEGLAMDARLANWEGGRRYTCPSYEITRDSDDVTLTAPGFQPYAVYWALVANLIPHAEQRAAPESVEAALEWAGEPLATQELAVLCEIDPAEARQLLSRVATERPVGQDGFWSLA